MRQKPSLFALMCVLAACLAPPAQAAGTLGPVGTAIKTAGPQLGKPTQADLTRRLGRAKVAYRRGQWCGSVRELGGLVKATGKLKGKRRAPGAAVGAAATTAQQKIFKAHARSTGYCGLKAPKVRVSAKVKPSVASVPNPAGGAPLPVAAFSGDHATTDFIANEVVIVSSDAAKVEAFAKRWHGAVVGHIDPATAGAPDTWRVRVDASKADPAALPSDLRALDPLARGTLEVSSGKGLDLLALTADAAAHGLRIAPNVLLASSAVEDRTTQEQSSSVKDWNSDANSLWYNDPKGIIGTGEAWRTLQISGKAANRVKVGVVDGGFSDPMSDIAGKTGGWGGPQNPISCSGGSPCPFHGSNVSSTLGGIVDNSSGVAGSGGQVADIRAYRLTTGTMFDGIDGVYDGFENGAKVINISSGYEMDALVSFINIPYEDATQNARDHGTLVVASAGNEGRDVDAEDCFIVCWEEEWIAPCENDAVVCVGGITGADRKRAGDSNFGYEWTENAATSDVDIFAPWTTWVAGDGAKPNVRQVSGTSFSSPFVAGIAADMLAVNPALTPQLLEQGLRETATSSGDSTVSRVVNADDAVKWAFQGQHIGPMVKVSAPSGAGGAYGGFNPIALKATAYTVYNDPACCSFAWSSPGDGPLGTGAEIGAAFTSPGTRTVTATATDGSGAKGSGTIEVTATNRQPHVSVSQPAPGASFFHGVVVKFEASATDPNELAGLSCDRIHWKVTGTALPTQEADGCQPAFTFASDGTRHLTVTATDAYGATSIDTRSFEVVTAPPHTLPSVTIISPDAGTAFDGGQVVTLSGSATDPDTGLPLTGTWSVTDVGTGTTTVIGSGNSKQWTAPLNGSCHTNDLTLHFAATDGDGTTTKDLPVHVRGQLC